MNACILVEWKRVYVRSFAALRPYGGGPYEGYVPMIKGNGGNRSHRDIAEAEATITAAFDAIGGSEEDFLARVQSIPPWVLREAASEKVKMQYFGYHVPKELRELLELARQGDGEAMRKLTQLIQDNKYLGLILAPH